MVNARRVNGGSSYRPQVHFCLFLLALGAFLRFQNPFKYAGNFNINQKPLPSALWAGKKEHV